MKMFRKFGDTVKKIFLTSGEEVDMDDYYDDEDYYGDDDYDNEYGNEEVAEDPMQEHYTRGGAAKRVPERSTASERAFGSERSFDRSADRRSSYKDKVVQLGYASTAQQPGTYQPPVAQIRPVAIIAHPKEIADASKICDYIKNGKMVVVDLTGLDGENAQRIADYLGGVVHTVEGQTTRINKGIFSVSPREYEVIIAEEDLPQKDTFHGYRARA